MGMSDVMSIKLRPLAVLLCGLTVAASVLSAQGGPPPPPAPSPQVGALLGMARPAAIQAIAAKPQETNADLDKLRERFDASIRSARDVPEQRKVEYDAG